MIHAVENILPNVVVTDIEVGDFKQRRLDGHVAYLNSGEAYIAINNPSGQFFCSERLGGFGTTIDVADVDNGHTA